MLLELDVEPLTRVLTPAAIAAAAHGYYAPLARLAGTQSEAIGGVLVAPGSLAAAEHPSLADILTSGVLNVATSCVEDELPWSPASPPSERGAILSKWLASLPAGTTAPFSTATALGSSELPLCVGWPATKPAPPSPTDVSATPTLILSGEDDLRTPYEQVLANLPEYSDAQLLRVPDDGHSTVTTDTSGCAKRAMIEFIASGHAPTVCAPSTEAQALALPPAALAQVAGAASRSRLAGRVAAATVMTVEDVLGQTEFAGGGLRGGYWELAGVGLEPGASVEASGIAFKLHGMEDVRGVELSGVVHLRENAEGTPELGGRLSIRGRVSGRLTLHGRALSGRIDGARVRAHFTAL
jgi:hypothetical protein